ncbi:hypothetical protein Lal_00032166 [Lupinus albus]|nr:hypothetical protein Lal_00032166 [Lupinus albus]
MHEKGINKEKSSRVEFGSLQNRKRASNPIYPYRASRKGYRGVEEKSLEQSETPSPSSDVVELDVLWVDARNNKQGVIDNEKFQEAVNCVVTLKERESFRTADSQVILEKALGLPQYPGRIHGARFGASNQFLPQSAKHDALLPIPVEDDIITVGLDSATFVAWPKHLIDVVPIMGKVFVDDHSATSIPIIDEPASKKAKMNLPADSTTNISLPKPIYGFPTEEFITINDVKDVHGRDWIGESVLSVYISKKKVKFISPQTNIFGVGMVTNDTMKNEQAQYVAKIIEENKEIANLFFAPLNIGALNIYRCLNPKRQRLAKWTHVKTPCQNNNTDCGFYVINFMKEVIKQGKAEPEFNVDTYTEEQIDVNREIWSKFVYSSKTDNLQ